MALHDVRANILLSLQRALLGAVTHNMAAVTCSVEGTRIQLVAYLFREKSDEDWDALTTAGTELLADCPEGWLVEEKVQLLDGRSPSQLGNCVYMRREVLLP